MEKGAVNVAEDWIGDLQKPNGLKCPRGLIGLRRATEDAMVKPSGWIFR